MLEQRIHQHFIDSADLNYQVAQGLAKPVADALEALLVCVTSGGKVLAGDQGSGLAHLFSRHFIGGFEREPSRAFQPCLWTIRRSFCPPDPRSRPAGRCDIASGRRPCQRHRCRAFASRHHGCARTRDDDHPDCRQHPEIDWGNELHDTDIHIAVTHGRPARVQELQLQVLHALCDGIDVQLLGEDN